MTAKTIVELVESFDLENQYLVNENERKNSYIRGLESFKNVELQDTNIELQKLCNKLLNENAALKEEIEYLKTFVQFH
jgi:hypothetical protein